MLKVGRVQQKVEGRRLLTRMAGWQCVAYIFLALVTCSQGFSEPGKYLITAPQDVYVDTTFTVTLQVVAAATPVAFTAYLEYDDGNYMGQRKYARYTDIGTAQVSPGTVGTIDIQVPLRARPSSYGDRLHVRGTGGLQIEETYSVRLHKDVARVFVQTDKTSYQPGDTVTFTTFAIHKTKLTSFTGNYDVTLSAGSQRLTMKQWPGVGGTFNTFSYTLDSHTILGTWTVVINGDNTGTSHSVFEVSTKGSDVSVFKSDGVCKDQLVNCGDYDKSACSGQYLLWAQKNCAAYCGFCPQAGSGGNRYVVEKNSINVKVHLPKTMNSSTDLVGYFEASYPHGVGVEGVALVELSTGIQKHIQFQGGANFSFPYSALTGQKVTVKVKVTEDETGIVGTGLASVMVYSRDVKIEFREQTPAIFKPKLPLTVYVKISNHADEPLHIPADSVYSSVYVYGVGHYSRPSGNRNFGVSSFTGSYPILARKLTLPDSGLFSIDMDIPDDVTSIDIRVTFQGVQKVLNLQQAAPSETNSFLQIYLLGDVPAVTHSQSGDVNFRVVSSQPITDLTVELVSRERVVSAVKPTVTNMAQSGHVYSAQFSLTLTWDMTPVTEVIAYHIVETDHVISEVVSDSLALNVPGLLDTQIEVTSTEQRVEPGSHVTVQARAAAGSNIGVMVVENTEDLPQVTPELVSAVVKGGFSPLATNQAQATSQKTGLGAFYAARLLLMNGRRSRSGSTTSPVSETSFAKSASGSLQLPNVIFFGTNTTGSDGVASFQVDLPDLVTTWALTGFTYDDNGHIGTVEQPHLVEASYEVYGELLGPDQVVTGEQVILTAYIHNTKASDAQATVTLRPTSNVRVLKFSQNGSQQMSTSDQQQIVTVPAKSSRQVFFVVTSPADLVSVTSTAQLQVEVQSGSSSQVMPLVYTVKPLGVQQVVTRSTLTNVTGSVTHDLSFPPPKEALAGETTYRAAVTDDFTDLVLPLAAEESDVLEEGTGEAALLHLALPVWMAVHSPADLHRLRGPMERGYQRLMSFYKSNYFHIYKNVNSRRDWMSLVGLQLLAQASHFIQIQPQLVPDILYRYSFYDIRSDSPHMQVAGRTYPMEPLSDHAFAALYAIALENAKQTVNIDDGSRHTWQKYNDRHTVLNDFLRTVNGTQEDALSLSYLALASVQYFPAAHDKGRELLDLLMSWRDASAGNNEISWRSSWQNQTLNFFGDWLPARDVAESRDLVTAANALQALVVVGRMEEADRVATWLYRQRSGDGHFKTAWDTLAATQALIFYNANVTSNRKGLQVSNGVNKYGGSQFSVPGYPPNFTATGSGMIYQQLEIQYHVTDDVGDESFEVVPVVLDESLNHFKLMVCSRWLVSTKTCGVTIQEVTFPSGFLPDLSELSSQSGMLTFLPRNHSAVTIFLNSVSLDSSCYTVSASRVSQVARLAPAYVTTRCQDTPENMDIVGYQPRHLKESNVCDLCPSCCSS